MEASWFFLGRQDRCLHDLCAGFRSDAGSDELSISMICALVGSIRTVRRRYSVLEREVHVYLVVSCEQRDAVVWGEIPAAY